MQNGTLRRTACIRSTRWRGDAMHACTSAGAAGMLTGTFLDDVATNEIFALDTAGPPSPSSPPRNWLHASFHAIYSRPDRSLFIHREGRYWLCLSTSQPESLKTRRATGSPDLEMTRITHPPMRNICRLSDAPGAPVGLTSSLSENKWLKQIQDIKSKYIE